MKRVHKPYQGLRPASAPVVVPVDVSDAAPLQLLVIIAASQQALDGTWAQHDEAVGPPRFENGTHRTKFYVITVYGNRPAVHEVKNITVQCIHALFDVCRQVSSGRDHVQHQGLVACLKQAPGNVLCWPG